MVRQTALVSALALIAAGCGSSSTAPTSNVAVFTAQLSPANETPPIANAESSGSGTVNIIMVVTRDAAGTITGGNFTFQVNVANFPTTTNLTMSHIHIGAAGVAGPIRINTGQTPGEVSLASGSAAYTKTVALAEASIPDAQALLDNPGAYYFNVHSQLNGPGVARGQLVRTQ